MSEMTIKREEGATLLLPGSVGQSKPVTNSAAAVSTPEKTESSEKPGIIVPIVSATSQQKPVSSSCPKPKLHVSHAAVATAVQQRRSSTRSIKRKKFDDELVESSLMKSDRGRLKAPSVTEKADHQGSGQDSVTAAPPPEKKKTSIPPIEKKKPARSSTKRKQKPKVPVPASTKDLGRWKPQDDLALITAIQQTNDLMAVHLGVKFSCKFTLKEIQERWYALLYDPVISKLAVTCMKQLHPDIISSIQAKTLFSKSEEELLGRVTSTSQPTLEVFQDLLNKHASMFHPTRIAKALHNHWVLMKQYHLLPDQSIQPMPRGDHVLNFSDAEDLMNDDELREPRDEILENELGISDRRNKREIRHLEQELPKWQVLVDSVTGVSPPDFDNQTLAVLRGRLVRYLMRSREITLGRATRDNQIDVDLSLEGPAWKISRRQGVIKLRHNGDFFLANEGKRPIYIDGKPVLVGNKQKLNNNAVVEISCLRFIFLINQDLINVIRTEAQKMTGTWTTQA